MPFIGKRQSKEADHGRNQNMTLKTPTKNERNSSKTPLRNKVSSLMGRGRKNSANINKKRKPKWRFTFLKSKQKDEAAMPNVTVITPSTIGSGSHTYNSSERDAFEMVLDHSPLSPKDSARPSYIETIPNRKKAHRDSHIVTPRKNTSFDYCTEGISDLSVLGTDCVSPIAGTDCANPLADWGKFLSFIVTPPLEVVKDYVFGNEEQEDVEDKRKANRNDDSARIPFDEVDEPTMDDESLYTSKRSVNTEETFKGEVEPLYYSGDKDQSPAMSIIAGQESVKTIVDIPFESASLQNDDRITKESQNYTSPNRDISVVNERSSNNISADRNIAADHQVDLPQEEVYDTEFTLRFLRVS